MPTVSRLEKVLDLVGKFVIAQKGCWEHKEWEAFLANASKAGLEITDESKRCLGNLLESSKYFYANNAPAAKKKPAVAPAKAKAKPAAKAKAKPKSK